MAQRLRQPAEPQRLGVPDLPPPDHSLHQFDLVAEGAARLVAAAKLTPGTEVVEIGAGTGNLTAALLAAGAKVHAIELDPRRGAALRQRFSAELTERRLTVLVGDARHHHPAVAPDWQVIANPPFRHTAELLRRWLLEDLPGGAPLAITLLLQDQAARKLAGVAEHPVDRDTGAPPRGVGGTQRSRSSVLLNLWGVPRLGEGLPRDAVVPLSHVPLRLLTLRRHPTPPPPAELRRIDNLLATAFAGPHTVREALRGLATPAILKRQAAEHGWDPDAHPRTVPPEGWRNLAAFLAGLGRIG